MNRILGYLFSFLILGSLAMCTHEPIELPENLSGFTPPIDTTTNKNPTIHPCDPDTVYFERDVLPILVSNCAKSGCHDATDQQGEIIISSYSSIMFGKKNIINEGNKESSKLYKIITETDPGDRMPPQPETALNQDEIDLIGKWIDQGAKNLFCDQCDTLETYAKSVAPILYTNCKACHAENSQQVGPNLWFVKAGHTSSSDVIHSKLISLGGTLLSDALNGRLTGNYQSMPPGVANKLDTCQISLIDDWIDQGMPNN